MLDPGSVVRKVGEDELAVSLGCGRCLVEMLQSLHINTGQNDN